MVPWIAAQAGLEPRSPRLITNNSLHHGHALFDLAASSN